MNIFYSIILGIIQGLTEFLPISSTAHLTLAGQLFGLINQPEDWTAFIAIIQLGTVAAVIIYFFQDIEKIIRALITDLRISPEPGQSRWSHESHLGWEIALGTLPVAIIGLLLKKQIEGAFTKAITTIASSMVLLAVLLFIAEKIGRRSRSEAQTTWLDALVIGFAQACALIPGSSRSGTTITAGLFMGLTREAAARFSFLLSIPAVLASGLFELYQSRNHLADLGGIVPVTIATISAGIVGYASIAFLLNYLRTHTTYLFIVYRIIAGLLLWALLAERII